MIKIDSKSDLIDEKEITAYIQQQMAELSPHLEEKTALEVKLTPVNNGFEAEMTAMHPEGQIQTIGWNEDIFDAIKYAKEGMIEYFVEFENEMHPNNRDAKLQYMKRHGNLYLR